MPEKSSQASARQALEAIPDAVVLIAPDGRIADLNPAAERMFGCTRKEVGGQPLADLIGPTQSDERMDRLLATAEGLAGMGSWQLDLRTMHAMWSNEMYRIHGFEPGEVEPGVETLIELIHPDDRAAAASLLRKVVERPGELVGRQVSTEYRITRPDGSIREVSAHGHIEVDDEGRPVRWVGLGRDVTEQRLTERELQAHYAVSQALRDWESFDEGVVSLLRRLGTALDFPMGALWTWDAEHERLTCRAFWTAPGIDAGEFEAGTRAIAFRPGQGVPGRVWETREPAVSEELHTGLAPPRRAAAAELGLRTGLAFPVVGDDRTLAVLSFYAFDRRLPSEHLVKTLHGIGAELGRFLIQRRAELEPRRVSEREVEVLRLAAEGNSGPEIAERLFVSPATVKTHFEHIYEKLGVGDRAAAVAQALRTGLIR